MEILPCKEEEEEEECSAMELQQAVDPGIKSLGRDNNMITTHYGISGESSDEDDYTIPVGNEDCLCCVCGEQFPFLDQLMEHFKTHKDEVCCHLCQTNFSRAISLALHLKYAHPRYHLFCTICQVPFVSSWHLNEHLENHQKELTTHKKDVELVDVKPLIKMKDTDDIIESISIQSWDSMFLHDHSYCLPGHLNVSHSKAIQVQTRTCIRKCNDIVKCLPMDSLSEGAQQVSSSYFTVTSQHVKIIFNKEAQNNSPSTSRSSSPSSRSESACEEEYEVPGEEESTDSADEEDDVRYSGDSDYRPDEDLSSDSECSTGFDTDNSKSSLESCHEKTHANQSKNAESFTCSGILESQTPPNSQTNCSYVKFDSQTLSISQTDSSTIKVEPQTLPISQTDSSPIKFGSQTPPTSQTDSLTIKLESQTPPTSPPESYASTFESQTLPTSRTDSSTSAEKNRNDCEKNPTFSCRMCKKECKNRDNLLKHIADKHPTAVYICEGCFNTFPQQDAFQRHACWKRPTGQMSVLLATPGTQVPSHILRPKTFKVVPMPKLPTPGLSPTVASTKLSQNLKSTNLVPTVTPVTKIYETVGQTVTTLPQTTVPTQTMVAQPNVPVHSSTKERPSLPNQSMTTIHIPAPYNPSPQTQNKGFVTLSPTINFPAPHLVSDNSNKSIPAPRQTFVTNITPPGNPPVHSPSIVRASFPNQTMKTIRIPTQTQNKVVVSFSPTVPNFSAPILVSGNSNKSIPAPRQKFVAIITPSQLSGNISGHSLSIVRPSLAKQSMTTICIPTPYNPSLQTQNQVVVSFSPTMHNFSAPILVSSNSNKSIPASKPLKLPANALVTHASCPTLVSALLQKNQPKVSSHTSSAKVKNPTTGSLKAVAKSQRKSKDLAQQKTWRSKSIFPCRHCGAISRQPSLRLRHRYLHQRSRLYRCKCGCSFQRQLHLLRHQVQHAESVRFVCACCGSTFNGAHELARHKQGLKTKHRQYAQKQCISAFDCICGKMFARPSALLWHMLKNTKPLKHTRKKHGGLNEPPSAV
ncbi:uncharacterized protein [Misgurnus anguillicaudatus]|uniref:uncharacterized protein n=1 Tax=Misgurnus anguillicaudatus TaxID=75329 RepID=UPI003CCFAE40